MVEYICISFLSAITVCGNLLVIISIVYFKQLHSPTNALILSLAAADLLVGALVLPLTMKFSMSSCLYRTEVFYRYYAVCQPLTYRSKISSHVIVIMILMSWGVPALVSVGLVGFDRVKCVKKCFFYVFLGKIVVVFITFYIPLLLMVCMYLKIFHVAQKQAHSIRSKTTSGETVNKMQRKATKTLAIVMGVFLICWLPSFLCTTILSFSGASSPGPLADILNWLALSNSMLNPFIYAFFYSWFRSAFRLIISGKTLFDDLTNTKLH
ncbi:trace amine-associated receptor 1-like [Cololabis saira]|uniref:trace amine-associated receptor 1-like n=1 Tax=Cololabis saira TaxID=129043 RepID=UPI002AD1FC4B|nr:trace amine-associated receptor 1-like [Cololabis saira]